MVPGPRLISLSHRDHPRERAIRIPMAAPASIPFPVALAPLAPADDLALLTPAERGIWLALMDIAWDCGYYDHAHMATDFKRRMGRAPSDFLLSDSSKIIAA